MSNPPPPAPARRSGAWWRTFHSRPRLLGCMGLAALLYALLPVSVQPGTRVLMAWNGGAILYLLLAVKMMRSNDHESMRQRALRQDEGQLVILGLVVAAAAAVLLAVGSQIVTAKGLQGTPRLLHLGLAALTVLTSWLFTQLLFALHYAHDFYLARQRPGALAGTGVDPLLFPGTPDPRYSDFFYFACVIGTSGQTADVVFNGPGLRGVGTLHCVLAFFFNASLLALAINMAAGLL